MRISLGNKSFTFGKRVAGIKVVESEPRTKQVTLRMDDSHNAVDVVLDEASFLKLFVVLRAFSDEKMRYAHLTNLLLSDELFDIWTNTLPDPGADSVYVDLMKELEHIGVPVIGGRLFYNLAADTLTFAPVPIGPSPISLNFGNLIEKRDDLLLELAKIVERFYTTNN